MEREDAGLDDGLRIVEEEGDGGYDDADEVQGFEEEGLIEGGGCKEGFHGVHCCGGGRVAWALVSLYSTYL